MFFKIDILKNFAIFTGKQVFRCATLLKTFCLLLVARCSLLYARSLLVSAIWLLLFARCSLRFACCLLLFRPSYVMKVHYKLRKNTMKNFFIRVFLTSAKILERKGSISPSSFSGQLSDY